MQPIVLKITGTGEKIGALDRHGLSAVSFQVDNPDGNTFTIQQAILPLWNENGTPFDAAAGQYMDYPPGVADFVAISDTVAQGNYMFIPTHIKFIVSSAGSDSVTSIPLQQPGLARR